MKTVATPDGGSLESRAYTIGILLLGGLAAVASFRHVADAAIQFGQSNPTWLPYALAGTPDLLAVLAGLSIRRRKRLGASVIGPTLLLVLAVVVLIAAQLVTAQPTPGGWFTAAWPALAFLSVVALVETEPTITSPPVVKRKPAKTTLAPAPPGVGVTITPTTPVDKTPAPKRPLSTQSVRDLLPAGHQVAQVLRQRGEPLNRASLAAGLREAGHSISTTRAAQLLALLKTQPLPN